MCSSTSTLSHTPHNNCCCMLCRRTDVRVAVSSGQQQVGLHCSQLEVLQVLVDGTPAQVSPCAAFVPSCTYLDMADMQLQQQAGVPLGARSQQSPSCAVFAADLCLSPKGGTRLGISSTFSFTAAKSQQTWLSNRVVGWPDQKACLLLLGCPAVHPQATGPGAPPRAQCAGCAVWQLPTHAGSGVCLQQLCGAHAQGAGAGAAHPAASRRSTNTTTIGSRRSSRRRSRCCRQ